MLRLKRRHTRNVLMGLLVLLTLSWASMGCYACELGGSTSPEHAHHGDSDSKAGHEKTADSVCPHCAAVDPEHHGDGACDSPMCALYKVAADEQVGWSVAKADQVPDCHPAILAANALRLSAPDEGPSIPRSRFPSHTEPHPTKRFCVYLN